MNADAANRLKNKFVTVDGLKLRYIEEGEGASGHSAAWRVARIIGRCVPAQSGPACRSWFSRHRL